MRVAVKLPFAVRLGSITTVLLIVLAAFGLYQVKYRVQMIRVESAKVQRDIDMERENLHVVAAEWAYLTRPDRLKRLSEAHTNLKPLNSKQVIASAEDIPYPSAPVVAETPAEAPIATPVKFTQPTPDPRAKPIAHVEPVHAVEPQVQEVQMEMSELPAEESEIAHMEAE